MTIKRFILLAVLFTMSSAMIWAGCKSDCHDEYDSAIKSCKSQDDDPDDADELRQCIQNAKDEYESCIEECDSLVHANLYFALICEGELTMISGFPLVQTESFQSQQPFSRRIAAAFGNCDALPGGINAVKA